MPITLADHLRKAACGDRFPTNDLLAAAADALDSQAAEIARLRNGDLGLLDPDVMDAWESALHTAAKVAERRIWAGRAATIPDAIRALTGAAPDINKEDG